MFRVKDQKPVKTQLMNIEEKHHLDARKAKIVTNSSAALCPFCWTLLSAGLCDVTKRQKIQLI
jgi:hypothetical protein